MRDVTHIFQVMTSDVDFGGIVSNIVYIRWLEYLRNHFASRVLSIDAALERKIGPVLSRTEIDYLMPARLRDEIEGRMWLTARGRARFVLSAEFKSRQAGRVIARARQSGVFVSLESFRPVPLPPEFLKFDLVSEP